MLLQIKSSNKLTIQDRCQIVLEGDVGATKTNLSLFEIKGNAIVPIAEKEFALKKFKNLAEIIKKFLKEVHVPDSASGLVCHQKIIT